MFLARTAASLVLLLLAGCGGDDRHAPLDGGAATDALGPTDAGSLDASADASQPDAGSDDAGPLDAGPPDAGDPCAEVDPILVEMCVSDRHCIVATVDCDARVCRMTPRDCDDGDECTTDACDESIMGCNHTPIPPSGFEGSEGSPECANGLDDDCDGFPDAGDPDCGGCTLDSHCDDGNVCTDDVCVANVCTFPPVGVPTTCDDGDRCTIDDACGGGTCSGGPYDRDADGDLHMTCGGEDCDDDDALRRGDRPETAALCGDGIDNDCDGRIDAFDATCSGPICDADGWCWALPLPQGYGLFGAAAIASDDVWTVGAAGTVLRWDGSGFRRVPSGTWQTLRAITADASGLWAVGDNGTIVRWSGTSFTPSTSGTTAELRAVASAGTRAWAAGASGTLLEWNGTWSPVATGATDTLAAVSAASADEAWAAGGLSLLHRTASGWAPAPSPAGTAYLYDVVAVATNEVYLLSRGPSSSDVAHVWRWNGSAWTDLGALPSMSYFERLWVGGTTEIYAAGAVQMARWNGTAWSLVVPLTSARALAGVPGGDLWAFGDAGLIATTTPGPTLTWRVIYENAPYPADVSATSGGTLFVGNGYGGVGYWTGGRWRTLPSSPGWCTGCSGRRGLWASGKDDVWAVTNTTGDNLAHWDGSVWTSYPAFGWNTTRDIWGVHGGPVWASGTAGTRVWDGTSWSSATSTRYVHLDGRSATDVWGMAGSQLGHWDGTSWTDASSGLFSSADIWVSPTAVYAAVGRNVYRWNGTAFVSVWSDTSSAPSSFVAITGRNDTDIWVGNAPSAGYGVGALRHYDGTTWTTHSLLGTATVRQLETGPDGTTWAVTQEGILRRAPP